MKVNTVKAINFRSFDEAEAGLTSFTILIGKNGTGKSSLIQAITTSLGITQFNKMSDSRKAGGLSLEVDIGIFEEEKEDVLSSYGEAIASYDIKGARTYLDHVWAGKPVHLHYSLLDSADQVSPIFTNNDKADNILLGQMQQLQPRQGNRNIRASFNALVQNYVKKHIMFLPEAREIPSSFAPNYANLSDFGNHILNMKLNDRERYLEFEDLARTIVPEFSDVLVHINQGSAALGFRERAMARELFVQNISKGTREVLLMLDALVSSPKGSVILIEEPEIHLYPQAVKKLKAKMKEYVERKQLQIILSTHSAIFLQDIDPTQDSTFRFLSFTKDENGVCRFRSVTEDREIDEMISDMTYI